MLARPLRAEVRTLNRHVVPSVLALALGTLAACSLSTTTKNIAASVAGTVTPPSAKARLFALYLATGDTPQATLADTVTGAYVLQFLPPGEYTIGAVGTGMNLTRYVNLRSGEDTTGFNFQ
jgi:hypothetical protein